MGNKVLYTKHLSPVPGSLPESQNSSSEYPQVTVYFAESLFLFGFSYKPCCSSEFQVDPNIQSLAMQRSFSATGGGVRGWGAGEFSYLLPPGLNRFRMAAEEPQNAGKVGVFQEQAADWLRCHVSGVPDDRQELPTSPRPAARDLPLPCPQTTGALAGHGETCENNGASVSKSLWLPGLSSQPAGVRAPSALTSVPLLSQ